MSYKLAALVEYQGQHYCGWQTQDCASKTSVQEHIEAALGNVANHKITTFCAGRTDSGVHANAQVIHFNTHATRSLYGWRQGSNNLLPKDIRIQQIIHAPNDFHARFSAIARRYKYFIYNHEVESVFLHKRALWSYKDIDIQAMQSASQHLIGEHDFSALRSNYCQANNAVRNIEFINISKNNQMICIDIKANAFLHHMVRNTVGALLQIGYHNRNIDWLLENLKTKNNNFVAMAPAWGLYLWQVYYKEPFAKLLNNSISTIFY